jgi:nucleotide-binding universal stress UspA family protein
MPNNKRMLVAVDESDASRRAVGYVADMVGGNPGFHVGLFHLQLPPRMLEWGGSEDSAVEERVEEERSKAYEQMVEAAREKGTTFLQELQGPLAEKGIDVTARLVQFDEPLDRKKVARDLLAAAREGDYGTVVVGRHSFSGLKRLFQHHVGEELVHTGEGITIWVVE